MDNDSLFEDLPDDTPAMNLLKGAGRDLIRRSALHSTYIAKQVQDLADERHGAAQCNAAINSIAAAITRLQSE